MKKILPVLVAAAVAAVNIGTFGPAVSVAQAKTELREGMVVKTKGSPSLFYVGPAGKRYVFPNEQAFLSWYDNFSSVVVVDPQDVAPLLIGGNVHYKPGALLIKIDTDPKVYAVATNGVIRWVQTEPLAKQLYGDHWNLLVDDVPVAFFANYTVGTAIERSDDFDPAGEETVTVSISDNIRARQITRQVRQNLRLCDKVEQEVNKIQKRLHRRGLPSDIVVNDYVARCTTAALQPNAPAQDKRKNDDDDQERENRGNRGDKVTVCHIPPGNPAAKTTIVIGASALKAHLKHGDTLGACGGGSPGDTQPPVISQIAATSTAPTTATVNWLTNEPATGKVTYATQTLANASTTAQVATHAGLLTSHAVPLSGLATSTTYYFMLESSDASGNTATSSEMTFTTAVTPPVPDTAPPVISGITVTPQATSTDVAWATSEPATSKIVYATQTLVTATSTSSVFNASLVTAHALTLSNLATSTQYFFLVVSADANGNTATSTETTVTTLP